ncbi:MAG: branched-chain amino acid ABC transporter permease [Actinobacteria bacterium RBG_16_68_21]|nr:MAG: branched-chain amino acid ABC transporter permease [Actinobacteria bacterium RBG_16_68_21]
MRRRPGLIADYRADTAIFRNNVQRFWMVVLLVGVVVAGLGVRLPIIPGVASLDLSSDLMLVAITALFASIGAIGLNIVTGFAGQVSLGHAFFLGLGAFTAAVLGGTEVTRQVVDLSTGQFVEKTILIGHNLDMIIWLPAAGLVAAFAGLVVAPVAFRLRGLYLAFVTLGLVFLGEHLFREADVLTGGVGVGRETAVPSLFGFRFDQDGSVFGVFLSKEQKFFFLGLGLLIVMALAAKNFVRSRVGRALAAVRDRDIAAEMMGISLTRYKMIAFVVSSFYAGVAGALLYSAIGRLEPGSFNLLLSIKYIAMVLIGGVATVSGSIMGAVFITFLPKIVKWMATLWIFGFISESPSGGFVTTAQFEQILFGMLIVGFLIVEPLGLYGIWIRVRNYWKAWPFSY